MCRNISNMLLVLFAVLLILPESQGNGSGISLSECYRAVKYVGDIFCTLFGYGSFESLIYGKCKLVCKVKNVQLPKEACSNGSVPQFVVETRLGRPSRMAPAKYRMVYHRAVIPPDRANPSQDCGTTWKRTLLCCGRSPCCPPQRKNSVRVQDDSHAVQAKTRK
uniref:Putative ixodes 10 kDa peptide protein n=1 Tax=Ixodes ricinus TaxID=34613 RepID=A0A0K8RA56_IXORI